MAKSPVSITDIDTFNHVTGDPNQVAGLYFYSQLDCLVDLAKAIADDFFDTPHLYVDIGKIAASLARLHARYGFDEFLLARRQRQQIYAGLFGASNSTDPQLPSDFERLRNELVNACAAYAERVYDTGVEMLKERVRSAHRPLREFITGLQGDSIRWSRHQALATLTEDFAYSIFRNPGVAAVFSIRPPAKVEWPYDEDSNGDKLVQEVSRRLMGPNRQDFAPHFGAAGLTRERFSSMQRAALRGAEAIAFIIGFDERADAKDQDRLLTDLIGRCYTWGSALMAVDRGMPPQKPSLTGHPERRPPA